MRRAFVLALVAALSLVAVSCAPGSDGTGGFATVSKAHVPSDGGAVATTPLRNSRDFEQRLMVTGTFEFSHDGTTYDARYRCQEGRATTPHDFVKVDPPDLVLLREDKPRHTYEYALPDGVDMTGRSATVAIDTSRLVDHYLITPSEAKAALKSDLQVELRARSTRAPSVLARLIARSPLAIAVIVLGGGGLALFGGVALARATSDIAGRTRRIDRKLAAIERATATDRATFAPVVKQLTELRDTAHRIADEFERTGKALRGVDPGRLKMDVAQLERNLARAANPETRQEYESALSERRRALDSVTDLSARREQAVVRITKIEGVFDSSLLRVREAPIRLGADESERSAIPAILDQLAIIRDAISDARVDVGLTPRNL